ncbi:MAG: hypothetical protein ACF788_10520 [Novipirellula sp. JB048]
MKSKSLLVCALAFWVAPLVGCGDAGPVKPSEEQNAFASVEGLGDVASDEAMFADAFVAGAAPENRSDYAQRGYQVSGEPTFEGDNATVPVKIFGGVHTTSSQDGGRSQPSSATETEQVWTLQRVDGQWKIKDAPLR